ncbi:MAG TPA: hypothetical protein PKH07_03205, partial [bacterium]|nr:hypothetical protein [bacterium]
PGAGGTYFGYDPGVTVFIAGAQDLSTALPAPMTSAVRDFLVGESYLAFKERRFSHARLEYMTNRSFHDIDGDSGNDVDLVASSASSVETALDAVVAYAGSTAPVTLFLVGKLGSGTSLLMPDNSTLTASQLDTWLDAKFGSSRDIRILVEASNSRAFCEALKDRNRVVVSSAPDSNASFLCDGALSFLNGYATYTRKNLPMLQCVEMTKNVLTYGCYYGLSLPQAFVGEDVEPDLLYHGLPKDAADMLPPDIEGVFEPMVVGRSECPVEIFAFACDDSALNQVSALIIKPDGNSATTCLDWDGVSGSRKYRTWLDSDVLTKAGTYVIAVYATDAVGNVSQPKISQIGISEPSTAVRYWEQME